MDFSLYAFDNGVQILQLRSLNMEQVSDEVVQLVESLGSIDASQLAKSSGISLVLAAERSEIPFICFKTTVFIDFDLPRNKENCVAMTR